MLRPLVSCVGLCLVVSCSINDVPKSDGAAGGNAAAGATATAGAATAGTATASGGADAGKTSSAGSPSEAGSGGAASAAGSAGASSAGTGGTEPIISCDPDSKECAGKCVLLTDPAYGCGAASCDDSDCPNPGQGGMLACSGETCKIGSCGTGFKLCDGKCVALSDPTYGCGKATCDATACPAAGTGTLVCQGESCVLGSCGADTKKCGNKCVPTDRNNGCADAASCSACANNEECKGAPTECTCVPTVKATACSGKCGAVANGCSSTHDCGGCTLPQTCGGGGTTNVCGCTPSAKATACSGKACGTVSNGCGGEHTCGTCTPPANAVATCQSNACVNSCAAGIMPLTCPNTPANTPRCGVWSFETNTVEGWSKGDPSDPAITGKTTIAVGTAKKVDGSRALVVTTTIPGGENPTTFDYEQQITFEAPLCPDFSNLNLTNRVFEVNAYFERISGTPLTSANAKITAGSHSVGTSPFSVAEGVWLNGTSQVSLSATHLSITVAVPPRLATPWNGRIYFDVLALH